MNGLSTINEQIAELGIAYEEHRAYNECIQFEGDECSECDQFAAEFQSLEDAKPHAGDPIVAESSQGDQMQADWDEDLFDL